MNTNLPIITCRHVFMTYGRQEVLHDVCLELPSGGVIPFVGPNGAGKTTLLRAILGLLPIRSGRIQTPFAHKPPGYVPQQKAIDPLYPVSARRIVEMGLYPRIGLWRRIGLSERKSVDDALSWFNLAEHQDKTFGELSGGMRQKTLLARAFATEADVFILDEPTSELDERSERDVLAYLQRLCKEHGKT
ncbi:MAG: ATP-binding cassette domain-containing protein, partial [Kiritimatiellia bacterium]|nr:ATP-binding cassette domain-containing protein [Kiritimatiellia bacterium]